VLAYLDRVDAFWRGKLEAAAAAAGPDPRDQLVGTFDALVASCRSDGFHGCAFINTAAEAAPGTEVHARTVEHKAAVRAWVRGLGVAAHARDPDGLAAGLTLLLDGGLASGVLDGDPRTVDAARAAARALVDADCPP
jgi:AcrR family transcriptional regulator